MARRDVQNNSQYEYLVLSYTLSITNVEHTATDFSSKAYLGTGVDGA